MFRVKFDPFSVISTVFDLVASTLAAGVVVDEIGAATVALLSTMAAVDNAVVVVVVAIVVIVVAADAAVTVAVAST